MFVLGISAFFHDSAACLVKDGKIVAACQEERITRKKHEIKKKLLIKELIKDELNYTGEIIFPEHHQSHAASEFFPSPFEEAAFITMGGVGEWSTSSYGIGKDNQIELQADIQFPHSLGLLYSAFT